MIKESTARSMPDRDPRPGDRQIPLRLLRPETKPVVLVTNAASFVSRHVALRLSRKFNVVGLDTVRPDEPFLRKVRWIDADVSDSACLADTVRRIRADYGRRLASVVHVPGHDENPAETTRELVRQLRQVSTEQVVLLSSVFVNDPAGLTGGPAVASELLQAERIVLRESTANSAVVLRIGDAYDEEIQSPAIRRHIRGILEKRLESYMNSGDPTAGRAAIHVDDAAECVCHVITRRRALPGTEILDVAEEQVLSFEKRQELLGQCLHGEAWKAVQVPRAVERAAAWMRSVLDPHAESPAHSKIVSASAEDHIKPDIDRTRAVLQWTPQRSLETCIPAIATLLKADVSAWYARNGLPRPASTV